MEENKEKNKIKISLGTFTVLIVAMLILGMAIVLGFQKANEKSNIPQLATENEQVQQNIKVSTNNNQVANNIKTTNDNMYVNGYLNVDKINAKYKEILNTTNLGEIAESVGLPYIHNYGNGEALLQNTELLGSLMREGNVNKKTIPNELICRMGFNLLYNKELSENIDKLTNDLTDRYGWDNIPTGYMKSLDGNKDYDYNGKMAYIDFADSKLKSNINNIFGEISFKYEKYLLNFTIPEITPWWPNRYAEHNTQTNSYNLYIPLSGEGGGPGPDLISFVTDTQKNNQDIKITIKCGFSDYPLTIYADYVPNKDNYQYPNETDLYGATTVYPENENKEPIIQVSESYSGSGECRVKINNIEYIYNTYEEAVNQQYRKEIIEQLPTYKYTFKKDDSSGNYYFYSFEKVD